MNRIDLANQFQGVGAELGVAAGDYSAAILANPKVTRLYSIDRWTDHHDDIEFAKASKRLSEFGERSTIIRAPFHEAVTGFPDNHFDFLYFDGYAHNGQEHGQTFGDWFSKLKPGGILSGHDYCEQYPATVLEVDWLALKYGLKIQVTDDEPRSWYAVKP
jgi:hypothetical protein